MAKATVHFREDIEIFSTNMSADGRRVSPMSMRHMVAATNEFYKDRGVAIRVIPGKHAPRSNMFGQTDQALLDGKSVGGFEKIYLTESKGSDNENVLTLRGVLAITHKPTAVGIKENGYPGGSVYFDPVSFLKNGSFIGARIEHYALLGAQAGAFPESGVNPADSLLTGMITDETESSDGNTGARASSSAFDNFSAFAKRVFSPPEPPKISTAFDTFCAWSKSQWAQ